MHELLSHAVAKAIADADPSDSPMPKFSIEYPPEMALGDYSTNAALILAKMRQKEVSGVVATIASGLRQNKNVMKVIEKIDVMDNGFINFWVKKDILINTLRQIDSEKEKYGKNDWGKGKKWLIEHTSPNPNKAMHLGHLRNNVTGMAIANLWESVGIEVIRDCVDNNRGIAIARLMWGYLKFANKKGDQSANLNYWFNHQEEWQTPADLKIRPDRFVDELYVKASEDFKNKDIEAKVRDLVVAWEKKDKKVWALWEKVLSYSYEGQEMTLKRLGNKYDKVWHEHEHYQMGKDLVEEGLGKGIFRTTKDGAIITNLASYKIPDTVVIKSDGTSLYITQDLALTKLKREQLKPDKLFWVVGPEQSLAMKQVFAVSEQLSIGKLEDFTHIAFGYMSIKGQGKMSSRAGNVVYIDDLIDVARQKILVKMEQSDVASDNKLTIAEQVALGAVKYSILKMGRLPDMAFDVDESISLEGNSGPYLQYTYARTQSVLRKAAVGETGVQNKNGGTNYPEEETLLRFLSRFNEIILMSAKSYSPSTLANYLYQLAQGYNTFYNKHKIIGGENEEFRLLLTKCVGVVLKNGLAILGISAPSKM